MRTFIAGVRNELAALQIFPFYYPYFTIKSEMEPEALNIKMGVLHYAQKRRNIYKRKDGRWEGRYLKRTPDGRSLYGYVYAPTYRQAREKLRKAAVLWETAAPQDLPEPLLLASMAQRWQTSLIGQVKESTYVKYHTVLSNHILPVLGAVSVEDITQILVSLPGEHSGFFLTGEEERFTEPRTMQNHFYKVVAKAGMEKVNYHALRHTFATRCVELGFDVKSLSELLGHSTVSMTMDRYVHPSLEHKREHMQRLTELFPEMTKTAILTANYG